MRVLGVDPGTVRMGYGLVEDADPITFIKCGVLAVKKSSDIGDRLAFLYNSISDIIACYRPDAVAVEQPFVALNVRSAFAVGRAQAIAILASANHKIPSFEYTPAQVKQRIADYGASSKEQVQEMVRLCLSLDSAPEPDAADALAVAICHIQESHLKRLLAGESR